MISVYSIDAGLLGLALAYALNMMGLFQYSVRQSAEVENQVKPLRINSRTESQTQEACFRVLKQYDRFHLNNPSKFLLFIQLESVERVSKYLVIQSEGETITLLRPPPAWPQYGIITFEGSSLVSDSGTHFLRNIWCCIRAQEKVSVEVSHTRSH